MGILGGYALSAGDPYTSAERDCPRIVEKPHGYEKDRDAVRG